MSRSLRMHLRPQTMTKLFKGYIDKKKADKSGPDASQNRQGRSVPARKCNSDSKWKENGCHFLNSESRFSNHDPDASWPNIKRSQNRRTATQRPNQLQTQQKIKILNKGKNQNSILVLATLGVYLGLVLAGATPQVLAQAAMTRQFDVKDEVEFKDDLDNKPDKVTTDPLRPHHLKQIIN